MANAKDDLLRIIGENPEKCIICAHIIYRISWDVKKEIVLHKDYTDEEYYKFLDKLDFEYDEGYGRQELYGVVLFDDNSWLERAEYDGAEWWSLKEYPPIPEVCFKNE